jgi:hypothetical protein
MSEPVGMLARIDRGMVVTTEHLLTPDGHWARAFAGEVTIVDAKTALGFTPGERDHTWYVRVQSFHVRTLRVYIPGCKVASIVDLGKQAVPSGEVWS